MRAKLTIVIMLLTTTVVYASDPRLAARKQVRPAAARQQTVDPPAQPDGDDAYKANCARCHAAPRKMSERQTATIMLHMRARANLTAAQTDAILQYLIQ